MQAFGDPHWLVVGGKNLGLVSGDAACQIHRIHQCTLLTSGVDIMAALQDLPNFVSSFDYNLASQTFLQRPAAAGQTAHLDTFSVQHASEAIQAHGTALLLQAQELVRDYVTGQLQGLCCVLSQQEVQIVLEAASAAVRAPAEAAAQDVVGSRHDTAAEISAQHAQRAQRTAGSPDHFPVGEEQGQGLGLPPWQEHLQTHWLSALSTERLVEYAEVLQTGLQEQRLADSQLSCLDYIQNLLTGWLNNADALLVCVL